MERREAKRLLEALADDPLNAGVAATAPGNCSGVSSRVEQGASDKRLSRDAGIIPGETHVIHCPNGRSANQDTFCSRLCIHPRL